MRLQVLQSKLVIELTRYDLPVNVDVKVFSVFNTAHVLHWGFPHFSILKPKSPVIFEFGIVLTFLFSTTLGDLK